MFAECCHIMWVRTALTAATISKRTKEFLHQHTSDSLHVAWSCGQRLPLNNWPIACLGTLRNVYIYHSYRTLLCERIERNLFTGGNIHHFYRDALWRLQTRKVLSYHRASSPDVVGNRWSLITLLPLKASDGGIIPFLFVKIRPLYCVFW